MKELSSLTSGILFLREADPSIQVTLLLLCPLALVRLA
jgi:hypothetical protein